MKHYNLGNVWGQIRTFAKKFSKNKKTLYIEVELTCPNLEFGLVKVYGNIWGEANVNHFMDNFKVGDSVRLKGMFDQYENKYREIKSNYNFFNVIPWDPEKDVKHNEPRASFVLTGEVKDFEPEKSCLEIVVRSEGKNGRKDSEDEFSLALHENIDCSEIKPGVVCQVKGNVECEEDEYGDQGENRPVVREIKFPSST